MIWYETDISLKELPKADDLILICKVDIIVEIKCFE